MRTRARRHWLIRILFFLGRWLRVLVVALAVMGPAPRPPPRPPPRRIEARATSGEDDDEPP
ncbi:MAG TPA: hypothetical protein VFN67_16860 [Polyangiales bacterium]|nr:hypothetical protein [Polyangiales bacterium]